MKERIRLTQFLFKISKLVIGPGASAQKSALFCAESERTSVFQVFENMGFHFKNCHKSALKRGRIQKSTLKRADQSLAQKRPFERMLF